MVELMAEWKHFVFGIFVVGLIILGGLVFANSAFDTDGGDKPNVGGNCFAAKNVKLTDVCISKNSLREYYPWAGKCASKTYNCNCAKGTADTGTLIVPGYCTS